MASLANANEKRHWRVKDNIFSPWRDLPGAYTGLEAWTMIHKGRFSDAMPSDQTPLQEVASDGSGATMRRG
jgi:hypothetical protein